MPPGQKSGNILPMATKTDARVVRTLKVTGEYIRSARLRRGWSQADLAARVGASERTIRSLESGAGGVCIGTCAAVLAELGLIDGMSAVTALFPHPDDSPVVSPATRQRKRAAPH